ncbi:ABC transporter substrate-binding protein [Rubrivivax rivuli]|nr:ABC transporter substrate binding protein [Rubrivivax rivuli]
MASQEPGHPAQRPRRRLLQGVAAALALAGTGRVRAGASAAPRIAHVMSFDSPWRWTDGQLEGFREGLGLPAAEIAIFQMDTKRHASEEAKAERGRLARAFVDGFRPDLLYASDDDAQQHVTRHYLGSRLPLVFSGVNRDPGAFGFDRASNVTGVLEREHVAETLRLLRELVPGWRRLVVLSDHGPYWDAVIRRVQEGVAAVGGVTLTQVVRTQQFEAYCQAVAAAQGQADALLHLGILALVDAAGRPVPYQAVQRWVVENSRLPDASFWMDRVHHGTLASVTVSEIEQGRAAGRLARAILVEGAAPASLPMQPTAKGQPAISLQRARALGITVRSTQLLQSQIVRHYDWEAHR